jgi:hypothetical protein
MIDHSIALRCIIEKVWEKKEEAFCCFVDFKKAFDTVPRDKLWYRMEKLGVPIHLRATIHRLYEEVKVKIRTSAGIFESFRSDIGVKQGCPLSPTLFGLYIDKLEKWLNSQEGDGALLGDFVIRLLLYVDDLILIAKSALGLQEHLISMFHGDASPRVGVVGDASPTSPGRGGPGGTFPHVPFLGRRGGTQLPKVGDKTPQKGDS